MIPEVIYNHNLCFHTIQLLIGSVWVEKVLDEWKKTISINMIKTGLRTIGRVS